MKVSLITVCYNSESTIAETINCVLSQNYSDIEYLVIDGGSTDNTLNIIEEYKSQIDFFISEEDNGLYDAMNKGIMNASGDIVGILNSDDLYYSNTIIKSVAECFKLYKKDIVYGDLVYVNKNNINKIHRHWHSSYHTSNSFLRGWHPPHPAVFVKRNLYCKYGFFDLSFTLAADFDLMLRFFEFYNVSTHYLPDILVKMRLGGKTNQSFFNILIQNIEIFKSFKKYNISVFPPSYLIRRLFPKIIDFLKHNTKSV